MKAAIYSKASHCGVKVVDRSLPTLEKPTSQPVTRSSICFRIAFELWCLIFRIIRKIFQGEESVQDEDQGVMVLCMVKAGGLNPVDAKFLYGDKLPSILQPLVQSFLENRVCGIDFSGVVLEVSGSNENTKDGSKRFKVGDEVYGTMPPSFGSFAEYCVCPSHALSIKPQNLSFEQAAAIPLVGLTAYQAFKDNGLKAGDHVCILGASGGTGHVAVQIAKAMGARVTGVCSQRNIQFVTDLGADAVLPYNDIKLDLFQGLKDICATSGSNKFDIIFDSVSSHDSKDNNNDYRKCFSAHRLVHPRGVYINLGGGTLDWIKAHLRRFFEMNLFTKGHELFWIRFPYSSQDLKVISSFVEQSKLCIKVEHRFPLTTAGVQAAFELQLSRRVKGKIVISN